MSREDNCPPVHSCLFGGLGQISGKALERGLFFLLAQAGNVIYTITMNELEEKPWNLRF
jgi:hypothetical protein